MSEKVQQRRPSSLPLQATSKKDTYMTDKEEATKYDAYMLAPYIVHIQSVSGRADKLK